MKINRCLLLALLGVGAVLLSTNCKAETAEEMLSACRPITLAKVSNGKINLPQDFDSGSCWGAFGTLQALFFFEDANDKPVIDVCVPKDVTRTELIAIFVKHTENHPEDYGKDFSMVAVNSILDIYGCAKKK